ncbi:Uncharacterised protein [Catenibacterium mitsuokai]|nr:Uncharacterised protein [Catenibacterium mitsuokai]
MTIGMEKAILIQMIGMALFFSCYLLNRNQSQTLCRNLNPTVACIH